MNLRDMELRLQEAGLHPADLRQQIVSDDRLLAVTDHELVSLEAGRTARIMLRDISKISSDRSGMLTVMVGDVAALSTSIRGYDVAELKNFFSVVKSAVAQAKAARASELQSAAGAELPRTVRLPDEAHFPQAASAGLQAANATPEIPEPVKTADATPEIPEPVKAAEKLPPFYVSASDTSGHTEVRAVPDLGKPATSDFSEDDWGAENAPSLVDSAVREPQTDRRLQDPRGEIIEEEPRNLDAPTQALEAPSPAPQEQLLKAATSVENLAGRMRLLALLIGLGGALLGGLQIFSGDDDMVGSVWMILTALVAGFALYGLGELLRLNGALAREVARRQDSV
ncbi:hypothetical protein HNR42_000428 [Deinobacterium chartae]|uniref:Uncharacterized protein n=1 Tax=Deinobacterium chartae TaxID=521158 RepID=A0A841HWJ1_9DEIO|nr:hypothetical protein [Deinobacterium chartae]MBB6097014.1 hypothetical protein [Deinobacterium chartae]